VIPCDAPRLPANLFEKLRQALTDHPNAMAAYAVTSESAQPLCCLVKPTVAGVLGKQLDAGQHAAQTWLDALEAIPVQFDDAASFTNFNTPEVLQAQRNPS
jgi:molybdopterin-guanine dinucleotide biosynthesis protein A